MTREELDEWNVCLERPDARVMKDVIFDYFEAEIKEAKDRVDSFCNLNDAVNKAFKELQSRTCESCIFLHRPTQSCDRGVSTYKHKSTIDSPTSFSCNRYEAVR